MSEKVQWYLSLNRSMLTYIVDEVCLIIGLTWERNEKLHRTVVSDSGLDRNARSTKLCEHDMDSRANVELQAIVSSLWSQVNGVKPQIATSYTLMCNEK